MKAEISGKSNYDNADKDTYLSELNGQTFDATDYVYPDKSAGTTASYTFTMEQPVTDVLTFTPGGLQAVWTITLYATGNATGILEVQSSRFKSQDSTCYNLAGQRVSASHKGLVIVNGRKVIVK